jgi:hypothetical protein
LAIKKSSNETFLGISCLQTPKKRQQKGFFNLAQFLQQQFSVSVSFRNPAADEVIKNIS